MSYPVLIFSADKLRGRIIQTVLLRTGVESLLLETISQTRGVLTEHAPYIAILDTNGCFSEEIKLLNNLCEALEQTSLILLGNTPILDRFEDPIIRRALCLSDPLDPEVIVAKVKEFLSREVKEKLPEDRPLEEELKEFLRLD
jgi:hypothetical protein